MKVAELMQTELASVSKDTTLAETVVTLTDAHVLGLPVVDGNRFVGVISTSDVLDVMAERGRGGNLERLLETTLVSDLMTPRPQTVSPGDDVKVAAQEMLYLGIHRVFVVEDDQLIGVLSASDIVQGYANGKL